MERKKRKILRKILGWFVLLCLVAAVGSILFFSVRWVLLLIQTPSVLQEDETKYISPPSDEEILFRGTDGSIHLFHTGTKQDLRLTEGADYAPSWDTEGEGFYFLRKIDADTFTVYYYSLSDQIEKLLSTQEIYTAYDLPDPDNTWIRFSPNGNKIILSSMELGLQMIDRKKTGADSFLKRKSVTLSKVWSELGIVSRNDRFCLLSVHRKKNTSYIQGLTSKIPLVNQLYMVRTDFSKTDLIDQSDTPFHGYSFSLNGYTFAYSKNQQIFYVDSIQSIQPGIIASGTFPTIKPTQRYANKAPRWADFNLINAAVIQRLPAPFDEYWLFANGQSLATYRADKQLLSLYKDRTKSHTTVLGYQLVDCFLEDINQDNKPDLLCSWQSHEKALGAERLSQFSITRQGTLKEIFRSEKKLRNSWKWEDLNQDGSQEVLNLYVDWEGEEDSMLENLTWIDVYQVKADRWVLSNQIFPSFYNQQAEKYRTFLTNAIKNPSLYGKLITTLEDWIMESEEIAKQ